MRCHLHFAVLIAAFHLQFAPTLANNNWQPDDAFMLGPANYGGCIGIPPDSQTGELVLRSCNLEDDNVLWRNNGIDGAGIGNFRSMTDFEMCLTVEGTSVQDLEAGVSRLFLEPCDPERSQLQTFRVVTSSFYGGSATLISLTQRPDMCIDFVDELAVIEETPLTVRPCKQITEKGRWWLASFVDWYTIVSANGGCMARKADGSDDLYLQTCDPTGQDDYKYWRPDSQGRLRNRGDYFNVKCLQVGQQPEIANGAQGLKDGTAVYAKDCAKTNDKRALQVIEMPIIKVTNREYTRITLAERPDLCVTYFGGASAKIGESRIIVKDCSVLGGPRAKGGWTFFEKNQNV